MAKDRTVTGLGNPKADSSLENSDDDMPSLKEFDHDDDANSDADSGVFFEDGDKEEDKKEKELGKEEPSHLLEDTSAVCETVSKV
jgi:hypothetical protein